MKKYRIHICDTEVIVYIDNCLSERVNTDSTKIIKVFAETDVNSPSGKIVNNDYKPLLDYLNLPYDTSVYDYRTSSLDAEIEEEEEYPECDGCGHSGPDVFSDGFGFYICTVNRCTQLSVRGLSTSDFY